MKKFEEYLASLKQYFRGSGEKSNQARQRSQQLIILAIGLGILLGAFGLKILLAKHREEKQEVKAAPQEKLELSLADEGIDHDGAWRQHFERKLKSQEEKNEEKLEEMQKRSEQMMLDFKSLAKSENSKLQSQLNGASQQLAQAMNALEKMAQERAKALGALANMHKEADLEENDYQTEIIYSTPKSVKSYIPEGTFFVGKLLGGISTSTALGTAENNATSVTLRLSGRGNLHPKNPLNIQDCRITASAYGDISSQRGILRLEKMICLINDHYVESHISGQVFGPDGFNGIKGDIIETSIHHLKNAMWGGLLSGLAQNVQDPSEPGVLAGNSVVSLKKKKSAGEMFTGSLFKGVSNVGEKLADYWLRQAERMSPVLQIQNGVRVEAQITKGFFVGEIGTHKRIKAAREANKALSENSWEG